MTTSLVVQIPDDLMERLRSLAEREFRTPEGQVLWLIKAAAGEADRRGASYRPTREERIRAARQLFDDIRRVHLLAGAPSTRAIVKTIAQQGSSTISHTTVADTLGGKRVPSWQVLEKIVRALNGDVDHFRQLWPDTREAA